MDAGFGRMAGSRGEGLFPVAVVDEMLGSWIPAPLGLTEW